MSKQLLNTENQIFVGAMENLNEVIKDSGTDIANGKFEKAEIQLKLVLSRHSESEDSGNCVPALEYKIAVNMTDDTTPANSEHKSANIYKEQRKAKTIHKNIELIVEEDEVYTDELKTPLEKMAEEK